MWSSTKSGSEIGNLPLHCVFLCVLYTLQSHCWRARLFFFSFHVPGSSATSSTTNTIQIEPEPKNDTSEAWFEKYIDDNVPIPTPFVNVSYRCFEYMGNRPQTVSSLPLLMYSRRRVRRVNAWICAWKHWGDQTIAAQNGNVFFVSHRSKLDFVLRRHTPITTLNAAIRDAPPAPTSCGKRTTKPSRQQVKSKHGNRSCLEVSEVYG